MPTLHITAPGGRSTINFLSVGDHPRRVRKRRKGVDREREDEEEEWDGSESESDDPIANDPDGPKKKRKRRRRNPTTKTGRRTAWHRRLNDLRIYRSRYGHTTVRRDNETPDFAGLADWVGRQRKELRASLEGVSSTLTDDQVTKLREVGLSLPRKVHSFEERIEQLVDFKNKFGHTSVPRNWKGNPGLGAWVHGRRTEYRSMQKAVEEERSDDEDGGAEIDDDVEPDAARHGEGESRKRKKRKIDWTPDRIERIERLNELGFVWTFDLNAPRRRGPVEPSWEEMLLRLVLYKSSHGTCDVPESYIFGESDEGKQYKLGKWVKEMRRLYHRRERARPSNATEPNEEGELTDERIAALTEVGMIWDRASFGQRGARWNEMFAELEEFKRTHGHCRVPLVPRTKLSRWVHEHRAAYSTVTGTVVSNMTEGNSVESQEQKKKKQERRAKRLPNLTACRREKLDSIGFVWRVASRVTWDDRLEELKKFKAKHGHCIVPQHYKENKGLGKWVTKQRYEHTRLMRGEKRNILTDARIRALEELGFEWSAAGSGRRRATVDEGFVGV